MTVDPLEDPLLLLLLKLPRKFIKAEEESAPILSMTPLAEVLLDRSNLGWDSILPPPLDPPKSDDKPFIFRLLLPRLFLSCCSRVVERGLASCFDDVPSLFKCPLFLVFLRADIKETNEARGQVWEKSEGGS